MSELALGYAKVFGGSRRVTGALYRARSDWGVQTSFLTLSEAPYNLGKLPRTLRALPRNDTARYVSLVFSVQPFKSAHASK